LNDARTNNWIEEVIAALISSEDVYAEDGGGEDF
jgi:hypothetical protein